MSAGLLTDLQLVLEQAICASVALLEQGSGLRDIVTSSVITTHQREQQGSVDQRYRIACVAHHNGVALFQGSVQILQIEIFQAAGCLQFGIGSHCAGVVGIPAGLDCDHQSTDQENPLEPYGTPRGSCRPTQRQKTQ